MPFPSRRPKPTKPALPINIFIDSLFWIDDRPLSDIIEPYRRRLFERFFGETNSNGHLRYNLLVHGVGKKNYKTTDAVVAGLYALTSDSPGGSQVLLVSNDEGQSAEALDLAKKIVRANPALKMTLAVRAKNILRRDGRGHMQILPARFAIGEHGRTYRLLIIDEIHGHRDYQILEALQIDPHRKDCQMWITSYASIYHRPGIPLFDYCDRGWRGEDPRMLFSWYAGDRTTNPDFADCDPETRANPSRNSWVDPNYLEQQRSRLPTHQYRRLHLNLPGAAENAPFQVETIVDSIARGVKARPTDANMGSPWLAFCDMSGGSVDDCCLALGYRDADGKAVVGRIIDQGAPTPFDPRAAIDRFAYILKEYGIFTVMGDRYAGLTFELDFQQHGIGYQVCSLTKSQLFESLEPRLNSHQVILLDVPKLEQQLLGLQWKSGKIDHPASEHDDYANAAAGLVYLLAEEINPDAKPEAVGRRTAFLGAEQSADELIGWEQKGTRGSPDRVRVKSAWDVW